MTEDFEKNRAEYVVRLEQQLQHANKIITELKADAKWTPKVASEVSGANVRITLAFGGKTMTASIPTTSLELSTPEQVTSAVIETLFAQHIADKFRPVITPEIARVTQNVRANAKKTW